MNYGSIKKIKFQVQPLSKLGGGGVGGPADLNSLFDFWF